jgi:hypothetical protein
MAALCGNLDNMKWLKSQDCPWNTKTFAAAAKHGNLDNMKWLKSQDCPWDAQTFTHAVIHGDLDNLRWLKNNKFHIYSNVFERAIRNASYELLEFLHEIGVYNISNVDCYIALAINSQNLTALEWLHKRMGEYKFSKQNIIDVVKSDNMEIIKWTYNNDSQLFYEFELYVDHCSLTTVKWIIEKGCYMNTVIFQKLIDKKYIQWV